MGKLQVLGNKVNLFGGYYDVIGLTEETDKLFAKEWSDETIQKVKAFISYHFRYRTIQIRKGGILQSVFLGTREKMFDIFGLAYTSHGLYACLTAGTNYDIPLLDSSLFCNFHLNHFAIMQVSGGFVLVAVCKDYREEYIGVILKGKGVIK